MDLVPAGFGFKVAEFGFEFQMSGSLMTISMKDIYKPLHIFLSFAETYQVYGENRKIITEATIARLV